MNQIRIRNLLLVSLVAETICASYGLVLGEQASVISICYLIAGLVFIVSVLFFPEAQLPTAKDLKKGGLIKLILLLLMVVLAYITARYWLDLIPIDPDFADMLPVIKVMNERFLQGQWRQVYEPIPQIWHGTQPIYLPAMWMPYAGALFLGVDMRWVTVGAILLSFTGILGLVRLVKNSYFGWLQLALAALLFWWIFARNEVHNLVSMSEEGVIIFYFVLLTVAIISRNIYFMAVATSLCILSRYSMIGWVIPCLIFLYLAKEYRRLIIFMVTGIFFFLFFFYIPFGFKTLEEMFALPGNYVAFANFVWKTTPEVFWLNLGMAKFFGPHHTALLHHTLLILSFLIPLLFMCFCLLQKKWKLHNVNLACFKLSILVFYQFIDVPYGYLFYTASFVSMVVASALLKGLTVDG